MVDLKGKIVILAVDGRILETLWGPLISRKEVWLGGVYVVDLHAYL